MTTDTSKKGQWLLIPGTLSLANSLRDAFVDSGVKVVTEPDHGKLHFLVDGDPEIVGNLARLYEVPVWANEKAPD